MSEMPSEIKEAIVNTFVKADHQGSGYTKEQEGWMLIGAGMCYQVMKEREAKLQAKLKIITAQRNKILAMYYPLGDMPLTLRLIQLDKEIEGVGNE